MQRYITPYKTHILEPDHDIENLSDEAAARRIDQVNQGRSNHYHQYTGAHWTDARDYDLVVNTSSVGLEQAANIILQCVKDKMKN